MTCIFLLLYNKVQRSLFLMHEHHVILYSRRELTPVLHHISICMLWHMLSRCLQFGAATRSHICQTVRSRVVTKPTYWPTVRLVSNIYNSYFHTDFTYLKCLCKCHPRVCPKRWRFSHTLSEWAEPRLNCRIFQKRIDSVKIKWLMESFTIARNCIENYQGNITNERMEKRSSSHF